MRGKRAFQLSATFLVILIITIVIFTGAIYFTKKFFSTAEEMRATVDEQTEAEIEELLYQQGSIVAIPVFKKTLHRGEQETFGVGVRNILEKEENFYVIVSFKNAFTPSEEIMSGPDMNFINTKWLLYDPGPYKVEHNKLEIIPVLANADLRMAESTNTEPGVYSFNVCIFTGIIPSGFDCSNPQRALPDNVYSDKIYKIYVEVI